MPVSVPDAKAIGSQLKDMARDTIQKKAQSVLADKLASSTVLQQAAPAVQALAAQSGGGEIAQAVSAFTGALGGASGSSVTSGMPLAGLLSAAPQAGGEQDRKWIEFAFVCPAYQGEIGALRVVSFDAYEGISDLFEININLASRDAAIDFASIVDQPASLVLKDKLGNVRFFNGVVSGFEQGDSGQSFTFYRLKLRPSLHRMRFGSDSRIFQKLNVMDIAEILLSECGIVNYRWQLEDTRPMREYCVQYNELNYQFFSRLLAEEGIAYYFEHTNGGQHTLVMTDTTQLNPLTETLSPPIYNPVPGGRSDDLVISQLHFREQIRPGGVELNDYTFKNPAAKMATGALKTEDSGVLDAYRMYEYPARFKDGATGERFKKYRMEELRRDARTARMKTNVGNAFAGGVLPVLEHPRPDLNGNWLITSVRHHGEQGWVLEDEAGDAETRYENQLSAMPSTRSFRPPRIDKPKVEGTQMATVAGPKGEEIYCDEHGRVKVEFPWDRGSKTDEFSSCWIRASQPWAGGGMGGVIIPRVGHEVIVSFLEGDPDQPIIVGRTHNAKNKGSLDLPGAKTQTVLKSATHKGAGANELRFEDEGGKQELYMHAQKDMNTVIKDNETLTVEAGNRTVTLQTGDETKNIDSGNLTETIALTRAAKATVINTTAVGGEAGPGTQLHEATDQITLRVVNSQIVLLPDRIELQHGPSKITLNGQGISLDGPVIHLNKDK
ncbi:type VI secretion system Vgr family protein [Halocynthiibacter sp.]|uniref:type VI secretion system Vgr family protein n=1 Tax=Halocynthiibacter sp. TaxID=1979210 RepID=UPI003C5CAFE9